MTAMGMCMELANRPTSIALAQLQDDKMKDDKMRKKKTKKHKKDKMDKMDDKDKMDEQKN